MRQLLWARRARNDLFEIAAHYRELDPDLEFTILERVETAPLILLDFPEIGAPTAWADIRKWRVAATPFLLLYRAGRQRVEIRRVLHYARDWQHQL
ncbi:MAG: type II toxin-antitoxin system RelE/ParE family toxin [Sphingomonas sp.]|uniref:type II toxin-antitoxin system RelE/ParE family toxin n=1 Tax=Sphingomonas sp. TaxID=28214 RepID=UPI0025FEB951|nr:type II toxin-antitoxin system RelE/ParE family toxin [Sphingomonas sp.]MBX9881149.1 type II toxin-antitoxin system RelE/ParE family toxin [Sphingomonas sp.]